jgi:thymidylate synthase
MKQYLDLARTILEAGKEYQTRGATCKGIFGAMLKFDMADGFPAVTTKKLYWKTALRELLWMISGSSNARPLMVQGVHIWTEFAHKRLLEKISELRSSLGRLQETSL